MRLLLLTLLLTSTPSLALAQYAPRSLSVEAGAAWRGDGDLAGAGGLSTSWWIAEGWDLRARVAWASARRTVGRGADSHVEAGAGVRWSDGAGALRPSLGADLSVVQSIAWPLELVDAGVRIRLEPALQLFLARDVAVAMAGAASVVAMGSGAAWMELGLALRAEVFF